MRYNRRLTAVMLAGSLGLVLLLLGGVACGAGNRAPVSTDVLASPGPTFPPDPRLTGAPPPAVTVTLSTFSGWPNPAWPLEAEQVVAVREIIAYLQPTERPLDVSKAPPYGGFWLEGGPIAGAAGRLEVYDGIVVLRDGQYREVGRLAGRDSKLEAYLFETARAHLDASAYQAAYGRFCEVVQRFSLLTPAAPPTRVMAPAPAVTSIRTPVPGPAAGAAILFARVDDLWRADLNGKEERLTEGEVLGWGSQEYAQKAIAALPSVSPDGCGDPEVVVEDGFLLDVIPQWQGVPGVQSRGWAVTALAARQRGNLCHLFLKTRLAQPCTRGPGWASLGVSGLAAT